MKMDRVEGSKGKKVLVTITPYTEQGKRVLNGVTSGPPIPPPLPPKSRDDAVEMQSIESFKLKDSPQVLAPRPPSTYFSVTTSSSSGANSTIGKGPPSPRNEVANDVVIEERKATSPSTNGKPMMGKVAIRIGSYEGETKQPSRLEFLPQQQRAEDKSPEEHVASRLQNELAATLQRANLRRKTENVNAMKTPENENAPKLPPPGNVEKLATLLSNKVTIKVNPESNNR